MALRELVECLMGPISPDKDMMAIKASNNNRGWPDRPGHRHKPLDGHPTVTMYWLQIALIVSLKLNLNLKHNIPTHTRAQTGQCTDTDQTS